VAEWEWTDWDRLMELLERGWSDGEIGLYLRMPRYVIRRAREKRGWRPGAELAGMMTMADFARRMGMADTGNTARLLIDSGVIQASIRQWPGRKERMIGIKEEWLLDFLEDSRYWHLWSCERIADPKLREWAQKKRTEELLTLRQVGDELCVTESTVRSWLERNPELRAVARRGAFKSFYIPRSQVDRWREQYVYGEGVARLVEEASRG
jgi:transcriptional regulator with XRE-family HTH domain